MKHTLFLLICNLMIALCADAQTPAQTVPDFILYKLDKTLFSKADLAKNKMLFFFFFDPACEHCQRAATNLNLQQASYKNASVYLISEAAKETMLEFINQYLPQFNKEKNVTILQDDKNEFLTKFQPLRYPAMFLYDENKKLVDYEDNAESIFRFKKPLATQK